MRYVAGVVIAVLVACGSGSSKHSGSDAGDAGDDANIDAPADAIGDATGDAPTSGIGGPPLGACTDGSDWCWVLPLPQGYAISAVWASSASDVWVSTSIGTMFHFDGTSWTEVSSPGSAVNKFIGSASNDLWAVTDGGTLHWDGAAWTTSTGAADGAHVLAQFGANDVWTVNRDTANHWDGATWTAHPGPGFVPLAIGGDASNLIAISTTGTIAKLLGSTWGVADGSSHPGNDAVVIDPTHIVVLQDFNVAFWNNGVWTTHTPPVLDRAWRKIIARSFADVWITSVAARYHWDGATWTAVAETDPTNPSFGSSLWLAPNDDLYLGDADAQVRRWNGTSWTSLTTGPGKPNAVWGTTNTDIWAIGTSGFNGRPFALHWNGTTWTSTALEGTDTVDSVNAIWGTAPNDVWIAGGDYQGSDKVQRQMVHWDGTQWAHFKLGIEDAALPSQGFRLIRGFAANDIFAASPWALYHYDGTAWSPVATPVSTISDVFGSSASDLYVAGGATLAHWNGTAWTTKTAPLSITSGVAVSPTEIWLTGQGSLSSDTRLLHFDGTFFVTVTTGLCDDYQPGIVMHGGSIYTCEGGSIVTRPTALGGTPTPFAAARSLWNPWFAPDGHLYVTTSGSGSPGLMIH